MIISFSIKWPKHMGTLWGQSNYFAEKIIKCMIDYLPNKKINPTVITELAGKLGYENTQQLYNKIKRVKPKLHTIRADKANRWALPKLVHFVVFNRSKNMIQFVDPESAKLVQEIEIKHLPGGAVISIDGALYYDGTSIMEDQGKLEELAINDGFPHGRAFLLWFAQDFTGKLIHWTDKKY